MKKYNTYNIYYDEEGDFLEITFVDPPKESYCEKLEPGVFVRKNEEDNQIIGIGILSFKKRTQILKRILEKINFDFPLNISV